MAYRKGGGMCSFGRLALTPTSTNTRLHFHRAEAFALTYSCTSSSTPHPPPPHHHHTMAPKTAPLNLDSRIVIAGAGVFGLSTALWLARSGYTNIVVLDPYPVPSQLSAANDINKVRVLTWARPPLVHMHMRLTFYWQIIRTEYHYPVYGGIAREAYELWTKEQLYSQHFHKVGWFTGAPGDDERGKSIVKKVSFWCCRYSEMAQS